MSGACDPHEASGAPVCNCGSVMVEVDGMPSGTLPRVFSCPACGSWLSMTRRPSPGPAVSRRRCVDCDERLEPGDGLRCRVCAAVLGEDVDPAAYGLEAAGDGNQ